jgi:predicted dinucleotide-binding enzyme
MSFDRIAFATVLLMTALLPHAGRADTIAVIGTGEVSKTLGPRLAGLGHEIVYGSRSPQDADVRALVAESGEAAAAALPSEAAARADIVIVAVPWTVAEQVLIGLGDLSGKIVIDPINPRVVAEDGFRDFPTHVSSAERLQALAPRAFVVKAFNTISVDSMREPDHLGHPITIPIVGNDEAAKETVAGIVEALGYEAIDLGPVRFAHIVEGLYLLRSNARDILGPHFEYQFTLREVRVPQQVL